MVAVEQQQQPAASLEQAAQGEPVVADWRRLYGNGIQQPVQQQPHRCEQLHANVTVS